MTGTYLARYKLVVRYRYDGQVYADIAYRQSIAEE